MHILGQLMRQLLLIFIILFLACQTQKKAHFCSEVALVIQPDLDGCGLLLQLRNYERLLPINGEEFNFKAGQKVRISYLPSDAMSICMHEDQIVRLTCLQIMNLELCKDAKEELYIAWIKEIISTWKPTTIDKYTYFGASIYHCKKMNDSRWYDCHGNLLSKQDKNILPRLLEKKLEIWVAHR